MLKKTIIICGHPRSGTTLLARICNGHYNLRMTFEFGNFKYIGTPYSNYQKYILKRWRIKKNITVLKHGKGNSKNKLHSNLFIIRYLLKIYKNKNGCVDLNVIKNTLCEIFPEALIVGDKLPGYYRNLDKFSKLDSLNCMIIYRDCRDVVRSVLQQRRTVWRYKKFNKKHYSLENAVRNWLKAIEIMEQNNDKLYIIQYEDLVKNPDSVLSGVGEWLNIDPSGFKTDMIRDTSIGKYKNHLSESDQKKIIELAGPAMMRYGYL